MALKESIARKRHDEDMTQQQLADDLRISRSSLRDYETGRRKLPEYLRTDMVTVLDDPQAFIQMNGEATGGVYVPYLDGDHVDHHFAAMTRLAQKEIDEAELKMEALNLTKPFRAYTASELEKMNQANMEMLDAIAAMTTLVADNVDRMNDSYTALFRRWHKTLLDRKYIRKESL